MKPVTWVKKRPHWQTLVFSDETQIDMKYVSPRDVQKMLVQSPISVLEEVGSTARTGRAERGSMDRCMWPPMAPC